MTIEEIAQLIEREQTNISEINSELRQLRRTTTGEDYQRAQELERNLGLSQRRLQAYEEIRDTYVENTFGSNEEETDESTSTNNEAPVEEINSNSETPVEESTDEDESTEDNEVEEDEIDEAVLINTIKEHEKAYEDVIKEMNDRYDEYNNVMTDDIYHTDDYSKVITDFYTTMEKLNHSYLYERELLRQYRQQLIEVLQRKNNEMDNAKSIDADKKEATNTPVSHIIDDDDKVENPEFDENSLDEDEEDYDDEDDYEKEEEETHNYRSLEEILTDIREIEEDGEVGFAKVTKGDARRYEASNIKVMKSFVNEVSNQNYVYNIFSLAPAAIHMAINFVKKITGKFMLLFGNAKARIEAMKENIDNLSDDDLEVLSREYKGATAKNFVTNEPVDNYIKEAIEKYQYRTEIDPRRQALVEEFQILLEDYDKYKTYETVIKELKAKNEPVDNEVYNQLELAADGKAALVKDILKKQNELQDLQSDGIHGLDEDIRAKQSKMSRTGKRFAKNYNTEDDEDLLKEEARLKSNIDKAIRTGNDKQALENYVKYLKLEAANTQEDRFLFMKRSSGKREFDPLVEELDYRQDMLIRNILTTAVLAGTVVNIVSNISEMKAASEIEKSSGKIDEYSKKLTGNEEEIEKGLTADRAQTEASIQNANELTDDRANDWNLSSESYRSADLAHHAEAERIFSETQDKITRINEEYQDKAFDADYLNRVAEVNNELHVAYGESLSEGLEVLEKYAAKHPDIELDSLIKNYKIALNSQDGIDSIQSVAINSSKVGEELTKASFDQLETVAKLDAGIRMNWVPVIAAALLAGYNANQAKEYYAHSNDAILAQIRDLTEKDNSNVRKEVVNEYINNELGEEESYEEPASEDEEVEGEYDEEPEEQDEYEEEDSDDEDDYEEADESEEEVEEEPEEDNEDSEEYEEQPEESEEEQDDEVEEENVPEEDSQYIDVDEVVNKDNDSKRKQVETLEELQERLKREHPAPDEEEYEPSILDKLSNVGDKIKDAVSDAVRRR